MEPCRHLFLELMKEFYWCETMLVCFAVLKRVIILWGRNFVGLFWCIWIRRHIEFRKILMSCSDLIPFGLIQLIIASVIKAHCGCFLNMSRYLLSHITSISVSCF